MRDEINLYARLKHSVITCVISRLEVSLNRSRYLEDDVEEERRGASRSHIQTHTYNIYIYSRVASIFLTSDVRSNRTSPHASPAPQRKKRKSERGRATRERDGAG